MILVVLILVTVPEVSNGCPLDTWPFSGSGYSSWQLVGPITITLPGTMCQVTITYCERSCTTCPRPRPFAWVIESITPVPGSGCDGMPPDQLIVLVTQYMDVLKNDPLFTPPPCSDGTTQTVVEYAMDCWQDIPYVQNGQTYHAYFPCGNDKDYCTITCQYCTDSNGQLVQTCSSTSSDDGTCTPLPLPDKWQPNTCYDIQVCGGPN